MGNTSEFYKDNISKQRTFQPNHENINLSKMFRNSTELKPSFKVDSNILPLLTSFPKYKKASCSSVSNGSIKSYGVNSYRGLVKKYNEDRVSIIFNIAKPQNYTGGYWPKNLSIFGLFDGHSGNKCCDFLRDNFHLYLIRNPLFPKEIEAAISDTFAKLENDFLSLCAVAPGDTLLDKSGSCAIETIIADKTVYVANVGDSRAIMSNNFGEKVVQITEDNKPNLKSEKKRIKENEGVVYKVNSFNTLYRILPGNLSVSRTIGDASSKVPFLGVVISTPEIFTFHLEEGKNDFIVMGSDGIFDKLDNEDLVKKVWSTLEYKDSIGKNVHEQSGICSDMTIKMAMSKKSKDNVSAIFIGFENFELEFLRHKGDFFNKSKTVDFHLIMIVIPPLIHKLFFSISYYKLEEMVLM